MQGRVVFMLGVIMRVMIVMVVMKRMTLRGKGIEKLFPNLGLGVGFLKPH
jgi:hypothetical protein